MRSICILFCALTILSACVSWRPMPIPAIGGCLRGTDGPMLTSIAVPVRRATEMDQSGGKILAIAYRPNDRGLRVFSSDGQVGEFERGSSRWSVVHRFGPRKYDEAHFDSTGDRLAMSTAVDAPGGSQYDPIHGRLWFADLTIAAPLAREIGAGKTGHYVISKDGRWVIEAYTLRASVKRTTDWRGSGTVFTSPAFPLAVGAVAIDSEGEYVAWVYFGRFAEIWRLDHLVSDGNTPIPEEGRAIVWRYGDDWKRWSVVRAAFSPGRDKLAVFADDSLFVSDLGTGAVEYTRKLTDSVWSDTVLTYDCSGQFLAIGGSGGLMIWDMKSRRVVYERLYEGVVDARFSPDVSELAFVTASGELMIKTLFR